MRKTTITILSFTVLFIFVFVGYMLRNNSMNYYETWKINWGISISKPTESKVIFESPPSFHEDGESYYVLDYDEKQFKEIKDAAFWHPLNVDFIDLLKERISSFKDSVIAIYPNEKEKYEKLFQANPIELEERGLYYYKKKDDGSYCIVILNVELQRVYMMEWTQ
ncbi:hypothetical protein NSQ91_14735 [Paenibacillus sp. FSL R7-0048]|uniref:hypothetical protein n=1 Tax=Paenibacillus TaxID=44249 RepID=UPI00096E75DB|nr:hypothetical protein [Paenibacillus odorifer]OMD66095.1 hypothetical protein BSK48_21790 [Paenibacillus odorifer]